jgi:hypothetical protein
MNAHITSYFAGVSGPTTLPSQFGLQNGGSSMQSADGFEEEGGARVLVQLPDIPLEPATMVLPGSGLVSREAPGKKTAKLKPNLSLEPRTRGNPPPPFVCLPRCWSPPGPTPRFRPRPELSRAMSYVYYLGHMKN